MIIKLIRHGESEANVQKVNATFEGDHSISLTNKGIQQARTVGQRLGYSFVHQSLLYTSPYLRAQQTTHAIIDGADCILNGSVPKIHEDPRLREAEFGFNKTTSSIADEKDIRNHQGYFYYRYKGGESPADVYDRISSFLETLMRQLKRKNLSRIIIVSHGITLRCFAMRFMHLSVEEFHNIQNPNNCDVITIAPAGCCHMQQPQFVSGKWGISGLILSDKIAQKKSDKALTIG